MLQELLTERLCLRRLQPQDAGSLYAYRTAPEVSRYQTWEPQSIEDVSSFIDSLSAKRIDGPGWYQIGIELRASGEFIGDCGIHTLESDSRIAEIGITIAPDFQSRGYATEALRALLDFLFRKLSKHRVTASVDPRNLKSMALMERVGMIKEGQFRQSLWFKGAWVDDAVFAVLASEWLQNGQLYGVLL